MAVADVVVVRDGDHYRIEGTEAGADSWEELEAAAQRAEGICDCGSRLSSNGLRRVCRTCGREYRPA